MKPRQPDREEEVVLTSSGLNLTSATRCNSALAKPLSPQIPSSQLHPAAGRKDGGSSLQPPSPKAPKEHPPPPPTKQGGRFQSQPPFTLQVLLLVVLLGFALAVLLVADVEQGRRPFSLELDAARRALHNNLALREPNPLNPKPGGGEEENATASEQPSGVWGRLRRLIGEDFSWVLWGEEGGSTPSEEGGSTPSQEKEEADLARYDIDQSGASAELRRSVDLEERLGDRVEAPPPPPEDLKTDEGKLEYIIEGEVDRPPWLKNEDIARSLIYNDVMAKKRQEYWSLQLQDTDLLARAVAVHESAPKTNNTAKVAFLFLTRGPLPLAPVWKEFFAGHEGEYSIYIHTRESYKYGNGSLPQCFEGRQIQGKDARWGSMGIVDAERRLLASAMEDPDNQRFVLVSETCLPLYNFTFTYNFLMKSKQSYIYIGDEWGKDGKGRWRKEFKPLIPQWQWRKSGQWFQITRAVANVIVSDTVFYQKFRSFCVPPCVPDEHYIPTMLNVLNTPNLARRDLTWTDWAAGGAHPREFGWGQANLKVVKRMRIKVTKRCNDTCYLFGRKFLEGTVHPFLKLHAQGLLWKV